MAWKALIPIQEEPEKARGREIHKGLLPTWKPYLAQEIPELQMFEGWESIQENKIYVCPVLIVSLRHLLLVTARNWILC